MDANHLGGLVPSQTRREDQEAPRILRPAVLTGMSSFDIAIPVILKHEGGWVDDPHDLGGETNFGISTLIIQRMQRDDKLDDAGMEKLLGIKAGTLYKQDYLKIENGFTKDSAAKIYRKYFWDQPGYAGIADQNLATKVMDIAVNCGEPRAERMLQLAVNSLGGLQVQVDGNMGPRTLVAVNTSDAKKLILALKEEQVKYYNGIAVARPANAKFLPGWLKRANWIDPTCW